MSFEVTLLLDFCKRYYFLCQFQSRYHKRRNGEIIFHLASHPYWFFTIRELWTSERSCLAKNRNLFVIDIFLGVKIAAKNLPVENALFQRGDVTRLRIPPRIYCDRNTNVVFSAPHHFRF